MKKLLSYYNYIVLTLLLVVVNLTYHPSFHVAREDAGDAAVKSVLSRYVLILAGLLVLPNIRLKEWYGIELFRKFVAYVIPLLVVAFVVYAIFPTSKILVDCIYFLIPLVFFLLGYQFGITPKQSMFFSFVYISFALLTGVMQVLTNIGSFVIMEQYMVSAKNSMACIFAVGIAVSFFWFLADIKNKHKLIFLCVFLLLFIVLFTIRGRAGILASAFSCVVLLYKYVKNNRISPTNLFFRIMMLACSILVILVFLGKLSIVWDYIYESIFLSHNGDVTTGRTERNIDAIRVIFDNMFFGQIGSNSQIGWVHNYILRVLSDYGIFIGGYLLIPYFYIIKQVYRNIINCSFYSFPLLGNVALIVPLVMSLFEPTFPYSPGSTIMFAYFLLGTSYSCKS